MNGIFLKKLSIGYTDIPKVACTSIKSAIYKLQTGKYFNIDVEGVYIHRYYKLKAQDISEAKNRFLIIRDPVKRFLSGYSNRVTHHKELTRAYLEKVKDVNVQELLQKDIPLDPGLGQFMEFFDKYYQVGTIKHHLRPICEIIDNNLDFYNYIYKLEDIDIFQKKIEEISKKSFNLPISQQEGRKYFIKDLTSDQLEFLFDFYKEDYNMLKDYYTIDAVWKAWKK